MRPGWLLSAIVILVFGCGEVTASAPSVPGGVRQTDSPTDVATSTDTLAENTLNTTLPSDVIREMGYFTSGGGGQSCISYDSPPPRLAENDSTHDPQTELLGTIEADVCGLNVGDIVGIEVTRPDGVVQKYEAIAEQAVGLTYGQITFYYGLDEHAPTGDYVLAFSGQSWTLQRTAKVVDADSARLYLLDNNQLKFYKFQPNERVRLLVYRDNHLIGWHEYQVDRTGELNIRVNLEGMPRFVAEGELSGDVVSRVPNPDADPDYAEWAAQAPRNFVCPGAPDPIGIEPGKWATVISDSLPPYADAGSGSPIDSEEGPLLKGTVLRINSNPICSESSWWWDVDFSCGDGDCIGYVQEADQQGAHLQPLLEAPAAATHTPALIDCAGAPPPRLYVTGSGRVAYTDGKPLNIRQRSGLSGKVISKIPEGTSFSVVEGPRCQDGFVWWKIKAVTGELGWVAEGDTHAYFVAPP